MKPAWPISACLITLNEEKNLPRCLESCRDLVDEIVVLDSGSTDQTHAIARSFGAVVHHQDWLGFVGQKNKALELASNRWVLSLDADETLSRGLREEIRGLRSGSEPENYSGFSMPRCVFYRNRWIRHGDWYPDRLVRIFRRDRARFEGGKVHERLEVRGRIRGLKCDLEHYSFKDAEDFRKRSSHYARLWAETQFENGRRAGLISPWSHALFRWLRGYLFRCGFLDGSAGLEIAGLCAREVWLKYTTLRRMSSKR